MRRIINLGILLLGGIAANATAGDCTPGATTPGSHGIHVDAPFILGSKRVIAMAPSGEDWKEDHCSGGALYKVGLGQGHPVDPYIQIGGWSEVTEGAITYSYTGGPSYEYDVYEANPSGVPSGVYYFCTIGGATGAPPVAWTTAPLASAGPCTP